MAKEFNPFALEWYLLLVCIIVSVCVCVCVCVRVCVYWRAERCKKDDYCSLEDTMAEVNCGLE